MHRESFSLIPAGYSLIRRDDEILLMQRQNTGYHDGDYQVAAAGHIENNEFATAGTIREVEEEIGLILKKEDMKCVHVQHRLCEDHTRVDFFFEVWKWEGKLENKEPDKCTDLGWFKLDKLPTNFIPHELAALKHSLSGVFYSEFTETGNKLGS